MHYIRTSPEARDACAYKSTSSGALAVLKWDIRLNPGDLCKLMIRADESTSQYAIYFHDTDQIDKGKKNQAEL